MVADQQAGPSEAIEEAASEWDEFCASEGQCRLWVRTIGPLLSTPPPDAEDGLGDRMRFAHAKMYMAACERMTRILNSDLGDQGQ